MISLIKVRGFRGIRDELTLDLADISLFSGRNGLGKTSVFNAVDWCLFGDAGRTEEEQVSYRNLYSRLEPHVELSLKLDGQFHILERDPDGPTLDGARVDDRTLAEFFVADLDAFPPYTRDLPQRIRRLVYLPQTEVRALLSADAASERLAVLQSILGLPDAQVVASGLRRIDSRLDDRLHALNEQLHEIYAAVEETLAATPGLRVASAPDLASTVGRARNLIEVSAASVTSPQELLAILRERHSDVFRRRRALQDFRISVAGLNARRAAVAAEQEADLRELGTLNTSLATAEEALRLATRTNELAAAQQSTRTTLHQALLQQLESLRRRLSRLDDARRISASIIETSHRESQILSNLAAAIRESEVAQKNLTDHKSNTVALRSKVDSLKRQERSILSDLSAHSAIAAAAARKDAVAAELTQHTRSAEQVRTAADATRAAISDARAHIILFQDSGTDRIAALLIELADLVRSTSASDCPLCGRHYDSHADLTQHVDRTLEGRTLQSTELASLQSQLSAHSAALPALDADLRARSAALSALQFSLSSIDSEGLPAPPRAQTLLEEDLRLLSAALADVETQLATAEHAVELAEADASASRQAVEQLRNTLAQIRQDMAGQTARLEATTAQEGSDLDRAIAQISSDVLALETRVRDETRSVSEADTVAQASAESERSAMELVQARRATLAACRSRIEARRLALEQLDEELGIAGRDAFGPNVPAPDQFERVAADRINALHIQERDLRAVELQLESAVLYEQEQSRSHRLGQLRDDEEDLRQRLGETQRAKVRFMTISSHVQSRADAETSKALQRLQEVVQYVFTAIYPHRHLDEVVFREGSAHVLLKDSDLTEAVRPDLYTSTGQLSVLALAVLLGTSLRQRAVRLKSIMLDEPIQSLDDLNFLSFITLIRRVSSSRQVILSTADSNIAELFRRQMKSSSKDSASTYVQWEWKSFDPRSGPRVERIDVRS